MKKMIIVLAMVMLSGCVIGTNYTIPVEGNINFKKFKTVKFVIEDKVSTEYSKTGLEMFRMMLSDKIGTDKPYRYKKFSGEAIRKGLGMQLVENDEDLTISIVVDYFKPDNKALRLIVGFGSGKGGIHYIATFTSKERLIAILDGGKSYGDVVMVGDTDSTIYRGSESTQILMVDWSVNEIVNFMREGTCSNRKLKGNSPESVSTATEKPITSTPIIPSLGTTRIVTWDFSVVKSAPGSNYPSIATVRKGDKLTIMEQSGEWVRVRLENGQEGWIRSEVLE